MATEGWFAPAGDDAEADQPDVEARETSWEN